MSPPRFATDGGRWDGWRFLVDCAGGCGASVVVTRDYVRAAARCITCGRAHWSAPVPQRPEPGATRRNGRALGQPGSGWPAELRASTGAVSLRKTKILESEEISVGPHGDPRVPDAAQVLARRIGGARILWSRARRSDSPTTATGKPSAGWTQVDEWVSVQWRVEGRPPTVMALWRNGRRAYAMIGARVTTHTAVGAL